MLRDYTKKRIKLFEYFKLKLASCGVFLFGQKSHSTKEIAHKWKYELMNG